MLAVARRAGANIEYTHRPLAEQLTRLGIRKFELDVFADPEGGRYRAAGRVSAGEGPRPGRARAARAGFQGAPHAGPRLPHDLQHALLPERSRLVARHPWHVPIMVMIEAKDSPLEDRDGVGFVKPLPIGPNELRALDDEIRSVFDVGSGHHARPRVRPACDARRGDPDGRLATAAGGPRQGAVRARQHRPAPDRLSARAIPSLEGRMLFVSSMPGEPSAGFIKMNEALGEDEERIRRQVRAGFRSDPRRRAHRGGTDRQHDAAGRGVPIGRAVRQHRLSGAQSFRVRLRRPVARRRTPERTLQPRECSAGCRDEWLEPRLDSGRPVTRRSSSAETGLFKGIRVTAQHPQARA